MDAPADTVTLNEATQTPARKTRVSWTDAEIRTVANEMALLRAGDPITATAALCEQAQKNVLPVDRQRALNAWTDVKGIKELFVDAFMNILHMTIVTEPATTVEPQAPEASLHLLSSEQLALELVRRTFAAGQQVLAHMPTIAVAPAIATAPTAPKIRYPILCVVGLLPNQEHALRERCRLLPVKLVFADKTGSPRFPSGADYCLLFTKFIDHGWQGAAVKRFGSSNVLRHNGGIDSAGDLVRTKFLSQ